MCACVPVWLSLYANCPHTRVFTARVVDGHVCVWGGGLCGGCVVVVVVSFSFSLESTGTLQTQGKESSSTLLHGETIPLGPFVDVEIPFVDCVGDVTVLTGDGECETSDSSADDTDVCMWFYGGQPWGRAVGGVGGVGMGVVGNGEYSAPTAFFARNSDSGFGVFDNVSL